METNRGDIVEQCPITIIKRRSRAMGRRVQILEILRQYSYLSYARPSFSGNTSHSRNGKVDFI